MPGLPLANTDEIPQTKRTNGRKAEETCTDADCRLEYSEQMEVVGHPRFFCVAR